MVKINKLGFIYFITMLLIIVILLLLTYFYPEIFYVIMKFDIRIITLILLVVFIFYIHILNYFID